MEKAMGKPIAYHAFGTGEVQTDQFTGVCQKE